MSGGYVLIPADIHGEKIKVRPERAKLQPVKTYYKRRRGFLYECIIQTPPENPWEQVVNYARYLREKYGKKVELTLVVTPNGRFLKFKREDGVPVYVAENGDLFTAKHYAKEHTAQLNATVRFLAESCGYHVKEKKVCAWW